MQNMMPQLNAANRTIPQMQTSQSAGKSGKPSQKDRFRDLLQNSPGKDSPKEMTAENNASEDKVLKPEPVGEKEKQQPSDARDVRENVEEKPQVNGKKEDAVPVEEEVILSSGMQMLQYLTEGIPIVQQTIEGSEDLTEGMTAESMTAEVPQVSEGAVVPVSERGDVESQAVLETDIFVRGTDIQETSGTEAGFAAVVEKTAAAADARPAEDHVSVPKAVLQKEAEEAPQQKAEMPAQPEHVQTDVQQKENSSKRESGQPAGDGREDTDTADSSLSYSAEQILRQDPAQSQVQGTAGTQQTVHIRANSSQELMNQLAQQLREKVTVGKQEFEIQIHPENLGRLAIKVAYAAEKVSISIVCSNEKTMEVLSAGAKNIAQIMEENLGTPTTVVVDQQEENYLEQYKDQQNSQQRQEQKKDKDKEHAAEDSQDFLQQLRLGLI